MGAKTAPALLGRVKRKLTTEDTEDTEKILIGFCAPLFVITTSIKYKTYKNINPLCVLRVLCG